MSTSQTLPAWKEEINAKVSEHRSRRRGSPGAQSRLAELEPSFASSRQPAASRIAARVAERYAKAPSYREMIEQQAAQAPARLIQRVPDAEPAQPTATPEPELEPSLFENTPAPAASAAPVPAEPPASLPRWAEFTTQEPSPELPVIEEPVAAAPVEAEPASEPEPSFDLPEAAAYPVETVSQPTPDDTPFLTPEEPAFTTESPSEQTALPAFAAEPAKEPAPLSLLDELAVEPAEPPQPLPARIIEFPRELVAPRKARSRAYDPEFEQSQLRIFEAEPQTAAAAPAEPQTAPEVESTVVTDALPEITHQPAIPDWNAIQLDEEPAAQTATVLDDLALETPLSSLLLDPPIYTANLEDRLMAGIVDLCLVAAGFLIFVAAFTACTPHIPTGKVAVAAAAAIFFGLFLLYQYLFLTFGEGTPGMRYAQIALCTFDDENPTRKSMRARILAVLLSALPLGLGFLWSLFDEDRLGWHDRITRTYQRSYRAN